MKKLEVVRHSPSPWCVKRLRGDHVAVRAADDTMIVMSEDWAERRADAEFIVRACNSHDDLLAALKESTALLAEDGYEESHDGPRHPALDRCYAAIDKAEGR